jgi:hypothetical protein
MWLVWLTKPHPSLAGQPRRLTTLLLSPPKPKQHHNTPRAQCRLRPPAAMAIRAPTAKSGLARRRRRTGPQRRLAPSLTPKTTWASPGSPVTMMAASPATSRTSSVPSPPSTGPHSSSAAARSSSAYPPKNLRCWTNTVAGSGSTNSGPRRAPRARVCGSAGSKFLIWREREGG